LKNTPIFTTQEYDPKPLENRIDTEKKSERVVDSQKSNRRDINTAMSSNGQCGASIRKSYEEMIQVKVNPATNFSVNQLL